MSATDEHQGKFKSRRVLTTTIRLATKLLRYWWDLGRKLLWCS